MQTTSQPEAAPGRARAILSLDGGGVRGTISVAFLKRIEALLRERDGTPDARLCDYFDLVGGTSTGAIIATTLSLGYEVRDIEIFYHELAPRVFQKSRFRLIGLQAVFNERNLKREIATVCGDRTLGTEDLKTLVAIVMKRMDTGSAWMLMNNPESAFWETPADGSFIGNKHYRLGDLVRASTAAPHYFAPEAISIIDAEPPGLFVDGGVTPHNNPALALMQMAFVKGYGLNWAPGTDNLLIVSVGTGTFRPTLDAVRARRMAAAGLAIKALAGMISDAGTHVMTQMQMLGCTDTPWKINSEIGDLQDTSLLPEPLFTFQRYDALLEHDWLERELGIKLSDRALETVRKMEDPSGISLCREIGEAAAEKMVSSEHFRLLTGRANVETNTART